MSILNESEPLIRVYDVPQVVTWLPVRRNGKKLGHSTVYKWIQSGKNGVKCESVLCGSVLCTSEGVLRRFFERLSMPSATSESRTESQATTAYQRACAELDARGI